MRGAALCALLTPVAILVHGYHPYAEDGGIYLAGIKYLLNPSLYPYNNGFATAHLHFSLFATVVAFLARTTAADIMAILFALHALSIFLTLFAAFQIARRLFADQCAALWSSTLLAASLTVPVAGTSLVLMDPYVTSRSFAMPCVLFAIAASLRLWQAPTRSAVLATTLFLAAALLLHPLSGGYAVVFVLFTGAFHLRKATQRNVALATLASAGVILSAIINVLGRRQLMGYSTVAQTRTYWFLSGWTWYEWIGLIGPLLILLWFARRQHTAPFEAHFQTQRGTARAAVFGALLAITISALFAHSHASSYAVARLQPLRYFQIIYALLVIFLGSALSTALAKNNAARGIVCSLIALGLFSFQHNIYANSTHVELPSATPANAYEQSFLWIRTHTAVTDVVALDANYISAPGEDAQNFRAIAERSTPADFSKDGGIAAIDPALTAAWQTGMQLQQNLNEGVNTENLQKLRQDNIHWIVIPAKGSKSLACPYRNETVAVCNL